MLQYPYKNSKEEHNTFQKWLIASQKQLASYFSLGPTSGQCFFVGHLRTGILFAFYYEDSLLITWCWAVHLDFC